MISQVVVDINYHHADGYAVETFGPHVTLAMSLTSNPWAVIYVNGRAIKEFKRFTVARWRRTYGKAMRIAQKLNGHD